MQQVFQFLLSKANYKQDSVVADPWKAVSIKNIKDAKDVTEIHLGNINAQTIEKFADFPNLETVWLNGNKLTNLKGLEKNYRIKNLYLHNNRISSISETLSELRHLQTLFLYNNQLRDLQKTLGILKGLKSLKHLELHDNPLSKQPNYKTRAIVALPNLQVFDRHKISQQERQTAIKFLKTSK